MAAKAGSGFTADCLIFRFSSARVPGALQRASVAAQNRDPESNSGQFGDMGPGSAAQRQNDAALRPGHESDALTYAVRSTGAGGCDGRISANATWVMPPASPSATPMRQAIL